MKKTPVQSLYNFLLAPLWLIVLPNHLCEKMGLTTKEHERIRAVLPHVKGYLLDIGCGENRLVKLYGNGVGVDIIDLGGGAIILEDSSSLPFEDRQFDTISFLASLNHIPNREEVVKEAARVLKPDGIIIVTMINPILGWVGHKLWWYGEHRKRKIQEGELDGMWAEDVISLMRSADMALVERRGFIYGMNNLFVFRKEGRVPR